MIDPELAALVDVLPVVDLNDIQVARDAFEQLITSLSAEIPGIDTLEIEDRLVPGHLDDPDVPVRVYRPMTPRNPPVPGVLYIHGGGLSAATALLARDLGGPPLCFQMLQIPELDNRLDTPSMQAFVDSPVWNRPLAVISWRAYLGELSGARDIPVYASPARASDLSGLPPAYISTAENDPLRDEGIIYAMRLLQAGISVELHQFPGTFHGSAMVTTAAVSKRAAREAAVVLRKALGVEREGATASG